MTSDSTREEPDPRRTRDDDEPRFGFERVRVTRRELERPALVWVGDQASKTSVAIEIDLEGDVHFGRMEFYDSIQPTLLVGTERLDRFHRIEGGVRFTVYPEIDLIDQLEIGAPIRFAPTATGPGIETGLTLRAEDEDEDDARSTTD